MPTADDLLSRAAGWAFVSAGYGAIIYGVWQLARNLSNRYFPDSQVAQGCIALSVIGLWQLYRLWLLTRLRTALVKDAITEVYHQMEMEPQAFSAEPIEGLEQYVELLQDLKNKGVQDLDVGNSARDAVTQVAWASLDLGLLFSTERKYSLVRDLRAGVFGDMRLTFGAKPADYGPTLQQAVRRYAFEHKITK